MLRNTSGVLSRSSPAGCIARLLASVSNQRSSCIDEHCLRIADERVLAAAGRLTGSIGNVASWRGAGGGGFDQ